MATAEPGTHYTIIFKQPLAPHSDAYFTGFKNLKTCTPALYWFQNFEPG